MSEPPVTVTGYATLLEAQLAQGRLQAFGIHARVPDQHAAGIMGELIGGPRGVRLQVRADDLERAIEILGLGAKPTPGTSAPADLCCAACGVGVDPQRASGPWWKPWQRRTRGCPACGHALPAPS